MVNTNINDSKRKTIVIGHKNPDTDSICSAIAYAEMRNHTGEKEYEACRAGELNKETEYVLKRFNLPVPRLCTDVRAQVCDMDIRPMPGVDGLTSLRNAWEIMRDRDVHSLPIVSDGSKLDGIITIQDVAMADMDSLDPGNLSQAAVPVSNVIKTLEGELITGDIRGVLDRGKVVIGAGSPEAMESTVEEGDIVLVSNRYESQLCAIELGVSCLIVCLTPQIAKTIVKLAAERGCTLISTPYDTYTASRLLNQSIPVRQYMKTNLQTFSLSTPVEEVRNVMSRVRFNYFPVVDNKDRYCGLISKRNLINLKKKELVLVDHNERSQCVDGFEEAEILGIVDHHRLGDLETMGPVFFRNQPVGCTATIIYQMYGERNIELSASIAGALCCAILSDTLAFHSPTCTKVDITAAKELAEIAGVELDKLAAEMFDAGEDLSGRTAEEVFYADYKVFRQGEVQFGVAQGNFNSRANLMKTEEIIKNYIGEMQKTTGVDMVYYIATSIPEQSSDVLCAGKYAAEMLEIAFGAEKTGDKYVVSGLMSRKKQFVPKMLKVIQQEAEMLKKNK